MTFIKIHKTLKGSNTFSEMLASSPYRPILKICVETRKLEWMIILQYKTGQDNTHLDNSMGSSCGSVIVWPPNRSTQSVGYPLPRHPILSYKKGRDSINGWYPQIIHFSAIFHSKPSVWVHLHLWKPPYDTRLYVIFHTSTQRKGSNLMGSN